MAVCFKIARSANIIAFVEKEFQMKLTPSMISSPTGELLMTLMKKFLLRLEILNETVAEHPDFGGILDDQTLDSVSVYVIIQCLLKKYIHDLNLDDFKVPNSKMFKKLMTCVIMIIEKINASKKDEIIESMKAKIADLINTEDRINEARSSVSADMNNISEAIFSMQAAEIKIKENLKAKENEHRSLQEKADHLNSELLSWKNEVDILSKQCSNFEDALENRKAENESYLFKTSKLKSLVEKKAALSSEVDKLRDEIEEDCKDFDSIPAKQNIIDGMAVFDACKELKDKQLKYQEENDTWKEKITNILKQLPLNESSLFKYQSDCELIAKSNQDLQYRLGSEKTKAESELALLNKQIDELNSSADTRDIAENISELKVNITKEKENHEIQSRKFQKLQLLYEQCKTKMAHEMRKEEEMILFHVENCRRILKSGEPGK